MWATPTRRADDGRRAAAVVAAGALVALLLGVYGRAHPPAGSPSVTLLLWSVELGPSMLRFKTVLTCVALGLGVLQVLSGLRLRDVLHRPVGIPLWLGDAHRLLGTLTLLCTIPVAYHCLWSLGFRTTDPRVLVHSVVGCFFYGIFVTKVLAVRVPRVPERWIPIAGGGLFASLVLVWATSAALVLTGRIG